MAKLLSIDDAGVAREILAAAAREAIGAERLGVIAGINQQTGAAYTLVLGDVGVLVDRVNAAANTVTVPAAAEVAFPVGSRIPVRQGGAGQTSIVAASGVTIQSASGKLKIAEQFAAAELVKVGADTWWLVGALAA